MLLPIIILGAIATAPISESDCGAELHKSAIARTQRYILNEVPMKIPRQPFAAKSKSICTKMSFDINAEGQPVNIKVERSSGSRSFDQAAVLSLKSHVFMKGMKENCRMNHVVIMCGSKP